MSFDTDMAAAHDREAVAIIERSSVEVPSTPMDADTLIPASQQTILSTEAPGSPMEADTSSAVSFQTEAAEDMEQRRVIPSSLTPPPSSPQQQQQPTQQRQTLTQLQSQSQTQSQSQLQSLRIHSHAKAQSQMNSQTTTATQYAGSQRSAIPSPPGTGRPGGRREVASTASGTAAAAAPSSSLSSYYVSGPEYVAPEPAVVVAATAEELRAMLQASVAEQTRFKTEAAHYKLQFELLKMQSGEDAQRAAVEHEMTRREVEALRSWESARQARRDLEAAAAAAAAGEASQGTRYLQLKLWCDELAEENDTLRRRAKLANRVISQKEEELAALADEKELLLNRLRENREHFHLLCSPGGIFHGAMTPGAAPGASSSLSMPLKPLSPTRTRTGTTTPYQTPKARGRAATIRDSIRDRDRDRAEPMAALLQALSQENSSAPSTPVPSQRGPPRHVARHQRNVQSMSSLPTTPTSRLRGEYALLPSVDLVPHTEPPTGAAAAAAAASSALRYHTTARFIPETPTRGSIGRHPLPGHGLDGVTETDADADAGHRSRESTISVDEETERNEELARQALESVAARAQEVSESQASQAASAMLRRDTREQFEGPAPVPTEKSVKLQAKLFGAIQKSGSGSHSSSLDKRKFGGIQPHGHGHGRSQSLGHTLGHGQRDDHGYVGHYSEGPTSPTKRVRVVPSLRDNSDSHRHHHHDDPSQVGLGIQYH